MEILFNLINVYVIPFWAMMILAPHWEITRRTMKQIWPIVILAVVYAALLVSQLISPSGVPLDLSLNGISTLLGNPSGATIGWAHFLAFDLFVGRWAYLDSRERVLPP
ncbi:MAG: DUF4281 domain-containing protein [Anaerolineae bacterium]|nr:DUF4281 domain-containing protein [Anaerolineae bacterium]